MMSVRFPAKRIQRVYPYCMCKARPDYGKNKRMNLNPATFIADTHVHVYPVHDAARLIEQAGTHLGRLADGPDALRAIFLTEVHGHDFFGALKNGSHAVPSLHVLEQEESEALLLRHETAGDLWLFAGRQIVTAERLEVLALTMEKVVEDGAPVSDIVRAVGDTGGIPVLSWAPGKWFFERGTIVKRVVEEFEPGQLRIGDTSLRPVGWPEPGIMKRAGAEGRTVLAGSDPLPFRGEERQAGQYAVCFECAFDPGRPVTSIRAALSDPALRVKRVGRRNSVPQMLNRLYRHRRGKKHIG